MPYSLGGGLAGGGSALDVCAISPTESAGNIDNLLSRIEKLEQIVSELVGANITAGSLSDLSQQIGWVGGIEYLGVPGWYQTEYGTLVPPKGFSFFPRDGQGWLLSDGSYYHGTSFDSDGILQFGFRADGQLAGEKVDEWNAGGTFEADYAFVMRSTAFTAITETRGITINSNTYNASDCEGTITCTIAEAGVYWLEGQVYSLGNGSVSGYTLTTWIEKNGVVRAYNELKVVDPGGHATTHISGGMPLSAGDQVSIVNSVAGLPLPHNGTMTFNLVQISR